jgi:cytochrome c oxidase subunit II
VRTPLFRRMKPWTVGLPLVLLSSVLIASCGNSPSILSPQGPVASQEANLFWFTLVVATIVFVIVEGWLIFSIVRYRERPNMPQPRQLHGNNTVEIIWTIVPSVFLFAVLGGTIYTMFGLQNITGTNKLEVQAIGHQWWWEFNYPNEHVDTADTLYIPKGWVIQADLVSNNVIHSFWIPEITGKTDVIPGHNNRQIFRADKAGVYRGICAEYCGTQHAHMEFNVVVFDSDGQYAAWVSSQQQAAQTPTDSTALAGQKLFAGAGGCTGCHGIVGVNLQSFTSTTTSAGVPTASLKGPNLTHFGSRSLIAGGVLQASDNHTWANDPACSIVNGQVANKDACGLYQWLHDPGGVKPGNDMAGVTSGLSDKEITELIAYLESLQ